MDKPVMQNISMNKRKKYIILLVLCLLTILMYLISVDDIFLVKNVKIPLAKEYSKHKTKQKIILYWNTFFGAKDMYFGTGDKIFQDCYFNNCYATFNRSMLPIEQFDAIIFHGARYSLHSDGSPEKRNVHQKYIFYSAESPYNIIFDSSIENFYNWTMTYRRDSDIYSPYGLPVKSVTNYEMPTIEDINNKTKMVAWFVSNCETLGSKRRMNYGKELSKYISVDIYGKCGQLECNNRTYCYSMLDKNYKFYLSFENSICEDYVTEKLFNVLHHNIVPIVLGFFDYSEVSPPRSVINAIDFRDPKHLAEYLYILDKNVNDYLKYFEWKKHYRIEDSRQLTLCQLCEKLNRPLEYYFYENIEEWFYGFKCLL